MMLIIYNQHQDNDNDHRSCRTAIGWNRRSSRVEIRQTLLNPEKGVVIKMVIIIIMIILIIIIIIVINIIINYC